MRPLQLTIEGLRSFRAPVTVDFTGRDHVAIVGDTGAGKSSILEAITYALYGQTTFSAQANQELMNDTSTDLRVVLRFRVSGEEWEVARTLRRAGDGAVGQARAQLRRIGEDGQAVEQFEQVRPVNTRVKTLIGLDSDAFLRTVVLPQGRFARLLVEDDPTSRSRILRQVWRTDELEAAGTLAGEARREAATLKTQLAQAASEYPHDPEAHRAQLEGAVDAARRQAATASEDERAAGAALDAMRDAETTQTAAAGVIARLRALDTGVATDRLASISVIDRQIAADDTALARRQDEVEEALLRIPSDDGPTSEEVTAALTTLQRVPGLAADCERGAADLRTKVDAASRKRAEARRLAEDAVRARATASEHAERRPPLDDAVTTARERRTAVEQKHARAEACAAEVDDLRTQLTGIEAEDAALAKRLETAREEAERAARAAGNAAQHLAAARQSASAAAAAHALHPGDECPICLRDLPADWEAPVSTSLGDAQQAADAAQAAAGDANTAVTRLAAERTGIARQLDDTGNRLAAADTRLEEARRDLAEAVGIDPAAPVPGRSTLLAPLDAACSEASDLLAAHDREQDALREASTSRETAASVAREAAGSADTLVDHARSAVDDAVTRLHHALREVPPPFRPRMDVPADPEGWREVDIGPVGEQTASARRREKVLAERTAERHRLRQEFDNAAEARRVLARRRAGEVDARLDAVVGDLNRQRDVLVESVGRLALDRRVPGAVSAREITALESRIGEIRTLTADVLHAADEQAAAASGRADAARAALAEIGARLDPDIDLGNLDAVVASARAVGEDARFTERRAEEQADDFAAIIDDVRQLQALLADVEDQDRALGDLEDALKPGAFLKWLTLRRSRDLLVHASRMLGEMSGGKYAFVDPREPDEQWRVLDGDSGQARSPASLSGGEQFIASLSLALGMVEMMARSGGRLESLFLDEGFGSLDRHNLDAAVQALGTVAAGGRMVGVISHVRAVAEQIDHVLAVTRGATGSQAAWLTTTQRQQLSETDTGLEALTAMAGLLE